MSQVALLVTLLLVAYFGGVLRSEQSRVGMASGIEYVLAGLILGPHLLGVLTYSSVQVFEPLLLMALGWLGCSWGMSFGIQNGKRAPWAVLTFGLVLSAFSCLGVGFTVALVAEHLALMSPSTSHMIGVACASVAAGTGHHAVDWAMRKTGSDGSLRRLLSAVGNVDDLVPVITLAGLVVIAPPETTENWSGFELAAAGLALGALLGVTVAALLGSRLRKAELWPVLLGAVLLVVGIVLRIDLPLLTPVFLLGLVVTVVSPHRTRIVELVIQSERPLFLPTLLLAGALVDVPETHAHWMIVGVALLLRIFIQFLGGLALPFFFEEARGHGWLLVQALFSASNTSVAMGLVIYLMHPGEVGSLALSVSVATTLAGEVLGAPALRKLAGTQKSPLDAAPTTEAT